MKYAYLILIVLAVFSCKKKEVPEIKPQLRDITEYVFASGTLEPKEQYLLVAQSDGYLTSLDINEDQLIVKGQLLAVIDNPIGDINTTSATEQYKIALENTRSNAPGIRQLEANLVFAQKKLEQETLTLERYTQLLAAQSIAKIELENAQLAAENTKATISMLNEQIKAAKLAAEQQKSIQNAALKNSQTTKAYNQLKAPAAGTVIEKLKQKGDYVRRGEVIATIGNMANIVAKLQIDENNIGRVKLGQNALLKLNTHKESTLKCTVSKIYPQFDAVAQAFIAELTLDQKPSFSIIGTQLEANIEVAQRKQVLVIPRGLLGVGNTVKFKGADTLTTIVTGITSTDYVEVLSGLKSTDVLVSTKPQ